MTDLVIGAVNNYGPKEVAPWLNSLERSGYTGRKALVVYKAKDGLIPWLKSRGVEIAMAEPIEHDRQVYAHRYLAYCQAARDLGLNECRNVIHTDVRDVVFQHDPSQGLHAWHRIVAATENVAHRDNAFARDVMRDGFGKVAYEAVANKPVYCSGVIAGPWELLSGLFLQMYLMTKGSRILNGDQGAFNIIAHAKGSSVDAPSLREGWTVNCAVAFDHEKSKARIEDVPLRFDGKMVTPDGGPPFCIVHQYDRVPKLKQAFEAMYGEA